MRRGTTPTFDLTLDTEVDFLKDVVINFGKNGSIFLTKTRDDCEIDGNTMSLTLTVEETEMFPIGYFEIQVIEYTLDNKKYASAPIKKYCADIMR